MVAAVTRVRGSAAFAALLGVVPWLCHPSPAAAQASSAAASVQWDAVYQVLVSALRTNAGQRAASGDQVATAARSAFEASASAIEQQQVAEQIARAKSRYAYETGQGYRACMVAPGAAGIGRAMAQRDVYARSLEARDEQWFSGGGDPRASFTGLIGLRRSVYCSPSERASLAGWCDPGLAASAAGYPAGNSDAGVFLFNRGYGAEEAMTALDYVDTVAPLPSIPPPGGAEAGGGRLRAIQAGAYVGAARANLGKVVLDGLQDTRPPPPPAFGGQP